MRRLALSTVAILAFGLSLAACSDGGSADGTGDKGASSQGGTDASDDKDSGKTGTPLAGADPCSLLKDGDVPELDNGGVAPKADGNRCEGHNYSVSIVDVDANGYAVEFEGSIVKPLPDIGGYKAGKRQELSTQSQYNSCAVIIAVTKNELVYAAVGYPKDPSKNCEIAQKAAAAIVNRFPG